MSAGVKPRPALPTAGLLRSIYLPRTADALAFAMSTYGIPLLVLATTRSSALTGLAFALEWIPRLAAFGWAGAIVDRRGASVIFVLASLGRALALAAGAVLLHSHPSGTVASATVMALAATTGVLTEFSYIAAETAGATAARRAGTRAHRVQAVLLGIDQTATLAGPALAGVLLLTGPPQMLAVVTALSLLAALLALRTPPSRRPGPDAEGRHERRVAHRVAHHPLPARTRLARDRPDPLQPGHRHPPGGRPRDRRHALRPVHDGCRPGLVLRCRRDAPQRHALPVRDRPAGPVAGRRSLRRSRFACLSRRRARPGLPVLSGHGRGPDGGRGRHDGGPAHAALPSDPSGPIRQHPVGDHPVLLLPFPLAGVLTALTPPDGLGQVITACAVLQALGLLLAFARLRTDPALRT